MDAEQNLVYRLDLLFREGSLTLAPPDPFPEPPLLDCSVGPSTTREVNVLVGVQRPRIVASSSP